MDIDIKRQRKRLAKKHAICPPQPQGIPAKYYKMADKIIKKHGLPPDCEREDLAVFLWCSKKTGGTINEDDINNLLS